MNIVYIHQHFCTPEGSSGTRSYDVGKHLVETGHRVTMICGVLDIGGITPLPWYRLFRRQRMAGMDVIICNVTYSNHANAIGRMWAFLWFAFLAGNALMLWITANRSIYSPSRFFHQFPLRQMSVIEEVTKPQPDRSCKTCLDVSRINSRSRFGN